jgi:acyl-CoA thioester hydrolase
VPSHPHRHLYRCPLRWADMDQLGHVNNVTYVDYLQEARVDMLRVHPPTPGGEELAAGVVVVRHEVRYLRPLVFRRRPVSIEVWVTELRAATFTLAYEVFDETEDGRRVYLQARSVLTPYVFDSERPRRVSPEEREVLARFLEPEVEPLPPTVQVTDAGEDRVHTYECAVRFSDVDVYRHVNNVKYFEYFQEARIALVGALGRLLTTGDSSGDALSVVVAQVDVDYRTPLLFREQAYDVDTWIAHVGRSSFVVEGQIRDGDKVLSRSRAVMVAFDAKTQRATALSDRQREGLQGSVRPGPADANRLAVRE